MSQVLRGLLIMALSAQLLTCGRYALSQDLRVLHADLSLHFVCNNVQGEKVEQSIEDFLHSSGFKVLNQGRIQRQHGVYLQGTLILAMDDNQRIVDIVSLTSELGRYALRVKTMPPTQRAVELERSLERFITEALACNIRQVTRGENGEQTQDLFQREVRRVEGLFRQGDALRGQHRT